MSTTYFCEKCHLAYPADRMPYQCCTCQGKFTISLDSGLTSADFESKEPGIWRFARTFGLPEGALKSYLGEGNTPLLERNLGNGQTYFKMESQNPTLSYKDRGTAVLTSMLRYQAIKDVIEDSSGNAGASLAAYSSAFGINAEIFVPANTSGPKLAQIAAYGAKIIRIEGDRAMATKAVLARVNGDQMVYASHAYQPFGLAGIATIAYEIYEQLGKSPDRVIAPIGHGSLFLGILLGFLLLKRLHFISNLPEFIGVQASNNSPLQQKWARRNEFLPSLPSIAEGVLVRNPIRGENILQLLSEHHGDILSIPEYEIEIAWRELRNSGLFVEPTSALPWAACKQLKCQNSLTSVLIMTGYGLKSNIIS